MPRYGFNLQWLFWSNPAEPELGAKEPDLKVLDAIAKWGFDFVRLPCDYRYFTSAPEYPTPDEEALSRVDRALDANRERGLHTSLNLHRAPGYVIAGWESEPHNLWADRVAQDAFIRLWLTFTERYRGVPGEQLSFDLVNEPPAVGERGFTRAAHEAVIRRTVAAIRAVDPDRPIVIDGLGGGHDAIPELADLDVIHSGRGYQPMAVSHYRAEWWPGSADLPEPAYPMEYAGRLWNRDTLREAYQEWREVAAKGVTVHIGEFGCYDRTPDDVALRWLTDLLAIFAEQRWGYALWNFQGPFGIVGHRREGAEFVERDGFAVDVRLLDLLMSHRVDDDVERKSRSST